MTTNFYLNVGYIYDKSGDGEKYLLRHEALEVLKIQSEKMGYDWKELIGKRRHRHLSDMRKIGCKFLYSNYWSYPQIGELMNFDHTTAIYHKRTCEELLKTDDRLQGLWLKFKTM